VPDAPAALTDPLPAALLGVAALWLLVSALVQWGARRAARLGARPAPEVFRAPPRADADAARAHVAFLGDLQRGVADVARPLARVLREQDVDLLVSSGDFVSHGEAPYYGVALAAFERAGVDRPVRVVPGNHDLWPRRSKDDRLGGALFAERFGARHWALRAGPLLVVGLDDGAPWLLEGQLPWLREVLDGEPGTPWILVCHRPLFRFGEPGNPPEEDLLALRPVLRERPPALVVSGHLHDWCDRAVDGVRHVVNAHGGDVHGLALRRGDFELLHVRAGPEGLEVERRAYPRRHDARTSLDQLAVRFWSDRRRPWGALLAWPVDLVARLLGRHVPVPRHPQERRVPDRETLIARRGGGAGRP
jgi:3',5'-cyclic AMP phosphodiesterase CpdA